jgi:hypothetical protein
MDQPFIFQDDRIIIHHGIHILTLYPSDTMILEEAVKLSLFNSYRRKHESPFGEKQWTNFPPPIDYESAAKQLAEQIKEDPQFVIWQAMAA